MNDDNLPQGFIEVWERLSFFGQLFLVTGFTFYVFVALLALRCLTAHLT